MKSSSKGRGRYTMEQQADWKSRFRSSGMTLERFAQAHGVKPGRLRYWIYQKRRRSVGAPVRGPGRFVEMKGADFLSGERWAVEIALSGGWTVRLREGVAPSWVGAVVASVRPLC